MRRGDAKAKEADQSLERERNTTENDTSRKLELDARTVRCGRRSSKKCDAAGAEAGQTVHVVAVTVGGAPFDSLLSLIT